MTLAYDVTRCMGLMPAPNGLTQRCSKRDTCQRYTDRATGGDRTPVAQWLCPGHDDYWQAYIKVEL